MGKYNWAPVVVLVGIAGIMVAGKNSTASVVSVDSAKPVQEEHSCKTDWKRCKDNSDLANNYSEYTDARTSCEIAANTKAKFGDPEWSWVPFGKFIPGNSIINLHNILMIDDSVKFQNEYGAMAHVSVNCLYNFETKKVETLDLVDS